MVDFSETRLIRKLRWHFLTWKSSLPLLSNANTQQAPLSATKTFPFEISTATSIGSSSCGCVNDDKVSPDKLSSVTIFERQFTTTCSKRKSLRQRLNISCLLPRKCFYFPKILTLINLRIQWNGVLELTNHLYNRKQRWGNASKVRRYFVHGGD